MNMSKMVTNRVSDFRSNHEGKKYVIPGSVLLRCRSQNGRENDCRTVHDAGKTGVIEIVDMCRETIGKRSSGSCNPPPSNDYSWAGLTA